jgi:hypothetical protein
VADEIVFYFDVLGFRAKAAGRADAAIDALTALARILGTPGIAALTGQWAHRYSLSDSVFLTHGDPFQAVKQAAALVFTLVHFTVDDEDPILVRGALALGPVMHIKGIFLTTDEPANLVGDGAVEAVRLEQTGLKGPRVLVAERLVRLIAARDADFVQWQLRPTSVPGVWEILWLLPPRPEDLGRETLSVKDVCGAAIRLLRAHGGHATYGDQYRAFVLLAGQCLERAARYVACGRAQLDMPLADLLPLPQVIEICESTSGLPGEFVRELRETLRPLGADAE